MTNHEDIMSIDELRREVRILWDREAALSDAIRDLPEVPDRTALRALGDMAQGRRQAHLWELGKKMQRLHGLDIIPPVSECETGAGLWSIMRTALQAAPEK